MTLTFDPTLKTFTAMPARMVKICGEFHWKSVHWTERYPVTQNRC